MQTNSENTVSAEATDSAGPASSRIEWPSNLQTQEDTLRVAKDVMSEVGAYCAWVGPLLEASSDYLPGMKRGAFYLTPWGGGDPERQKYRNEEKHTAYLAQMKQVMADCLPWLPPLLETAGATVMVGPGAFFFLLTTRLGYAFEVPQLIGMTFSVPFALEPDELDPSGEVAKEVARVAAMQSGAAVLH